MTQKNFTPRKGDLVVLDPKVNWEFKQRKTNNPNNVGKLASDFPDHPLHNSFLIVLEDEQYNNFGRIEVYCQNTGETETVWVIDLQPVGFVRV